MKWILIILLPCIICLSCQRHKVEVYYNIDIEKMQSLAIQKNKLFCCILIDTLSNEMSLFNEFIKTNKQISNNALFNFVEITDTCNFWYIQWLRPVSNIVSCVFSASGKLINLVNGGTYESFMALKKSILSNDNEYFYPNKWCIGKDTLIPFLDEVLRCKMKYDKGENIQQNINNSLAIMVYPFNLGLKLANELKKQESEQIKKTARELLVYKNEENIGDFFDLFLQAENILDKNYTKTTGPTIEIISDTLTYNCIVNIDYKIVLVLKNQGKFLLNIFDILTGCGCLTYEGKKNCQVLPGETINLIFNFKPDVLGKVERSVFIVSDAVNNCLYNAHLKFNINNNHKNLTP